MEYYTAVGIKREEPDGRFCVENAGAVSILSEQEGWIWSAAIWAFSSKEGLYKRIRSLLDLAFPEESRPDMTEEAFYACFQRLCVRRLLASGSGEGCCEAAGELFGRSVLGIAEVPFMDRIHAFSYSMESGNGLRKSMRAFQKASLDRKEKQVLSVLRQSGDIREWMAAGTGSRMADPEEIFKTLLSLYEKQQVVIKDVREA